MADTTSTPTSSESSPIYHDFPRSLLYILRALAGVTIFMVVLAFIFCLVKGPGNKTFYLLACNLIISSFVGIVNWWWYRKGDLGPDKFWYVMLVAGVIIFQCITTDIYVFHKPSPGGSIPPTLGPAGNLTTLH